MKTLKEVRAEALAAERRHIMTALRRAGTLRGAARLLGVTPSSLQATIRMHRLRGKFAPPST